MWKQCFWVWAVSCTLQLVHGSRILQDEERVRTDLIRLIPFNVQIAMTTVTSEVNVYALSDIVTDWMTDSFTSKSANEALIGNATTFQSLGLEVKARRNLQESAASVQLFTATFEGVSLWERTGSSTPPMDPQVVELIQRATFLEDNQLLPLLRAALPYTGLGDAVVDVRVYIAAPTEEPTEDDSNSDNLEIIIIIAIVVACLAFGLLMFAVVWAWRTDQSKREAYTKGDRTGARMDVPTGSEESDNNSPTGMTPPAAVEPRTLSYDNRPPAEIGSTNNDYPESVISEDISTSLTAYYRSGVAGYGNSGGTAGTAGTGPSRELNDAASMSSMDSYGYSLDGYAPSLGPAPYGYPVGPFNGMVKDPEPEYSEDEGTTFTKDGDYQ